jgi:hypothetical protein
MDRDGFISNGELYLVLKQMVGNNLKVGRGFLRMSFPLGQKLTSRINNYNRSLTRRLWRLIRMGKLMHTRLLKEAYRSGMGN